MVDIPTTKSFKGLVGDVLNLDTGSTFRQPHGNGRDTEIVNYITDDPDHYCKECKSAICKNCGREMRKKDLELGQNMSRKDLESNRSEVISKMEPNEYEEFINGRFEPLDKLPWFRKCTDSTTCEAYKHSKIEKNSFRIFSARGTPRGKFTYYETESENANPYNRKYDTRRIPQQCDRCGGEVKLNSNQRNNHPFWGKVCDDCADVLKDSDF